ncbi:hypothetical protein HK097_010480 [Rhizophlyctis rosea]|uniref:Uncharacterized protein n=1 Tax=Rhizophlyctis rosea TaxID=64517 RepID=A0AAD5X2I5_9FUNG|nr:hypothetical protein HK097_010480 [Rhizophlyctis rosea]
MCSARAGSSGVASTQGVTPPPSRSPSPAPPTAISDLVEHLPEVEEDRMYRALQTSVGMEPRAVYLNPRLSALPREERERVVREEEVEFLAEMEGTVFKGVMRGTRIKGVALSVLMIFKRLRAASGFGKGV